MQNTLKLTDKYFILLFICITIILLIWACAGSETSYPSESPAQDWDKDGFLSTIDCNDFVATINPGAEEIPDNDIDENCDGIRKKGIPKVRAGADPKTLVFNWNHIEFPSDTDHYQLQINSTGGSDFTTVIGADRIEESAYTLTIPVHLIDWVNAVYRVTALDAGGNILVETSAIDILTTIASIETIGYFKASNTDSGDSFGNAVTLSTDGNTLAIGSYTENSGSIGINGDEADNTVTRAGAVYIFIRSDDAWRQQAYIKSSNSDGGDRFGRAIALSSDGNTLAIGAVGESSSATGINGDEADNTMELSGAVYIFIRRGGIWRQQAYIKSGDSGSKDFFGCAVALSAEGDTLAVGALGEDSSATGIDGDEANNDMESAGAVYVFGLIDGTWRQQAYIKSSNTDLFDLFGISIALSSDGNTLAVGATGEDSSFGGINGDETDNAMESSGAVYIFINHNRSWQQQAYIKAGAPDLNDGFGQAIDLSGNGNSLVVGAIREDSSAVGVNGDEADAQAKDAGAVYLFTRNNASWQPQAFIKANNTDSEDLFGGAVALSADGNVLAVGAVNEDSEAFGINGDDTSNSKSDSGAVYIFTRGSGAWQYKTFIKSSNSNSGDNFGYAVDLSADGNLLSVGATGEDSAEIGINGDQTNNSHESSGAVYMY